MAIVLEWIIHERRLKKKQCIQESNVTSDFNYASPESHKLSYERSHIPSAEDIYETPNEPFDTLVNQSLQMIVRDKFVKSCIINWDHLDKNTTCFSMVTEKK